MKTCLRPHGVVASLAKAASLGGGSRLALGPNPSFSLLFRYVRVAVLADLLQPAYQFFPILLVRADDFGVIVEDALAQAGHQHVALRVAQLRDQRERQPLDF